MLRSDKICRRLNILQCSLCTGPSDAFRILSKEPESINGKPPLRDLEIASNAKVMKWMLSWNNVCSSV